MRPAVPSYHALKELRGIARSFRTQLIQGWMYHGNLVASLARQLSPTRPVVTWNIRQSLDSFGTEKPATRQVIRLNRWLSHRAEAVIYNSRLARAQHEAFGFSAGKGIVIPNGFDIEALAPSEETRRWARHTMRLEDNALVVGHVARFHPMKDHVGFLKAAVQVARARLDVRFVLIGQNVSLANEALHNVVQADFLDRFVFTGERHDIYELMQGFDVLCQSSWSEAFPNVLGEAMASGVPCVATDVGDSADIVGDTGAVVPPRDPHALAQALLHIMALPKSERRALGQAARKRIGKNFGLHSIVAQYRQLYERLISESLPRKRLQR